MPRTSRTHIFGDVDWHKKSRKMQERAAQQYGISPRLVHLAKRLNAFEKRQAQCSHPMAKCLPDPVQPYRGKKVVPRVKPTASEKRQAQAAYERRLKKVMHNLQQESKRPKIRAQVSRKWVDTASLAKLRAAAYHYTGRHVKNTVRRHQVAEIVFRFEENQRQCLYGSIRCKPKDVQPFPYRTWKASSSRKKNLTRRTSSSVDKRKSRRRGHDKIHKHYTVKELRKVLKVPSKLTKKSDVVKHVVENSSTDTYRRLLRNAK